uniref:HTH psq-type domain-containing protein n=1 Tax=Amphimedon queenslandica TaxID=400682 RepID=A0A1X7UUN1_AMPQE
MILNSSSKLLKLPSIAITSREFGVDRKRIREWTKQENALTKMKKEGKSKSTHLKGVGRRPLDEDMEESPFDWIIDLWQRNLRVQYKPIKTSRSVYVERPLGVSTLYKKRLLPFMVRFSMEHVFTLAQCFVLASLVFSSFLYSTDTTMLVLDCRSGDTTVISVQYGPQLKETLCESRCEVLVSSEDGPPGSV